jgi:mono/diheme cytochrome c family protein
MQKMSLRRALGAGLFLCACAMWIGTRGLGAEAQSGDAGARIELHPKRGSPLDLEVTGEIAGVARGAVLYVTRDELLALPQVSYTVSDDSNFSKPEKIGGVLLEVLAKRLGAPVSSNLIVAVASDLYQANYPKAYIAAHHPILVLTIDDQPPAGWPKDEADGGADMGPYLISHAKFTPEFTVFSQPDEAQIPWGVVRLEFRDERTVFGAIAPRGIHAREGYVQAGYRIARQNCYRCHNMGKEGGQKSGYAWTTLAGLASGEPDFFGAYIRDPKMKKADAQMPGFPKYSDKTIRALTDYFQTFATTTEGGAGAAGAGVKEKP